MIWTLNDYFSIFSLSLVYKQEIIQWFIVCACSIIFFFNPLCFTLIEIFQLSATFFFLLLFKWWNILCSFVFIYRPFSSPMLSLLLVQTQIHFQSWSFTYIKYFVVIVAGTFNSLLFFLFLLVSIANTLETRENREISYWFD